ncbi:NAD(P)/FAD-dependent oxidoreductase [Lentzea sp. NPDC060358]|uniref:NAD(P)/FAD-dependent oxidoreductase n=1 Tax=Lentzea sp. NPDC060358 TaxID=3347103 RepID=UPI00365B9B46
MTGLDRIVVVGAGLAGLHAAQALRESGFDGSLHVVGREPHLPYDRPPLSKVIPAGRLAADETGLPGAGSLRATWHLGTAATALDREARTVTLSDGTTLDFDRLLIATGTRGVAWFNEEESALDGVVPIRTRDDAADLRRRLASGPRRVVVIGGGFIGVEVASACRDLGIDVTVVEAASQPMENALGQTVGTAAASLMRTHGVDLRLGTRTKSILGDDRGRVRAVHLDDGSEVDADVVVTALGSRRNVEWLDSAGLLIDRFGIACDSTMRVLTNDGAVDNGICAAGDVARWPHPVFRNQMIAVEHWDTAVGQARHAAATMLGSAGPRWVPRPYASLPRFWSNMFGTNIKALGIPRFADSVQVVQGSLENRRAVILYGRDGHTVGAVAFNAPRELEGYAGLITALAPFPPEINAADWGGGPVPDVVPARFPQAGHADHDPTAQVVGPAPADPVAALGFPDPGAEERP